MSYVPGPHSPQNNQIAKDYNPLMELVEIWGKEYFTSQKHHRDYVDGGGPELKYLEHHNFLRRLREIEAWDLYIEHRDGLELHWQKGGKITNSKMEFVCHINDLPPVVRLMFKSNGYNPLVLINATLQLAMFEVLDSKLTKQAAVAKNTQFAREHQDGRKPSSLLPEEAASRKMKAYLEIAAMLRTPVHIAQQIATREIKRSTGIDLTTMLIASADQQSVTQEEMMMEPSKLAIKFGFKDDGRNVNRLLEKVGWQVKRVGGPNGRFMWEATPVGKLYSIDHPITGVAFEGYNLKWKVEEVRKVFRDHGFLPSQQDTGESHATR